MRDKLTVRKVETATAKAEKGKLKGKLVKGGRRYADGGGLYLHVSETGCKTWLFRYTRDKKAHTMSLGSLDDYGLAEARDRASASRKLLAASDPIAEKRVTQAQGIKVLTFEEACR